MRERQLDLRRAAMQRNLRLRSQVAMTMREFLVHQHGVCVGVCVLCVRRAHVCLWRARINVCAVFCPLSTTQL